MVTQLGEDFAEMMTEDTQWGDEAHDEAHKTARQVQHNAVFAFGGLSAAKMRAKAVRARSNTVQRMLRA